MKLSSIVLRVGFLASAMLVLTGCLDSSSSSSSSGTSSSIPDVAGPWRFTAMGGSSVLTINQDGANVSLQLSFGLYTGSVSGTTMILSGPGEEVERMEWNLQLNNDSFPTEMSGSWTDIEGGRETGRGPLSAVRVL